MDHHPNGYNWKDFTKSSLISIIKKWEHLVLPPNERGRYWAPSWGKQKLVNWMNGRRIFMAVAVESNGYNLELGMKTWGSLTKESQELRDSNAFLVKTLLRQKELSFSRCGNNIAEMVYNSELTCTICLDQISKEKYVLSKCGHHYCEDCFAMIDTCSVCRTDLCKDVKECLK